MPLKIKYQNIKLLQQQYPNFSFSRKFEQEIVDFDPIDDHRYVEMLDTECSVTMGRAKRSAA